jgi:hypothetical protein
MTTRLLMAVSSLGVLVLSGCASVAEQGGEQGGGGQGGGGQGGGGYEVSADRCPRPGGPTTVRVPVIAADSHLMVPPIKVCARDSVILNWRQGHRSGDVTTAPLRNSDGWLVSSNDSATELRPITTPADNTDEPTDGYKFTFKVEGVGLLDPRIVVQ